LFFWLALQKPKGEESETALFNVSPSYQLDFPPHQPFLQPIVVEEIYMHVAWSFFFLCVPLSVSGLCCHLCWASKRWLAIGSGNWKIS